jgi:hypothetical protein
MKVTISRKELPIMTTETQTQGKEKVQAQTDKLPYGVEFNGHITVARASAIANVKQSTINYWLREGIVNGFRLESDERDESEKLDRSAFLLVDRKSLQEWIDGEPAREAEKQKTKLARTEAEKELEAIRQAEKELKAKREALKAKNKKA